MLPDEPLGLAPTKSPEIETVVGAVVPVTMALFRKRSLPLAPSLTTETSAPAA